MEQSKHRFWQKLFPIMFWLAIWQILSMIVHQEILLVSPFTVLVRLFQLLQDNDFYLSICTSMGRILIGFLLGFITGIAAAAAACRFRCIEELLRPLVFTVKSIPVASFIIVVLIWVSSRDLAQVISFLMVFPIMYENILTGLKETDQNLLEMAQVFHLSKDVKLRSIYLSEVLPYLESGSSLALGLAWKSGIAAEVLGLPDHSIGEHLYEAKVYLNTPDLFAWTLVIVLLSVLFEKIFDLLIKKIIRKVETEE